jgi:hypothetical protein
MHDRRRREVVEEQIYNYKIMSVKCHAVRYR